MKDLTSKNIDAAIKIISGTAKTMGFKITKE
jgi:ribosomal protein L11